MPDRLIDIPEGIYQRLVTFAGEQGIPVRDVVLNILTNAIEMIDTSIPFDEIDAQVDAKFKPSRARPKIDRAAIRAMVERAGAPRAETNPPGASGEE